MFLKHDIDEVVIDLREGNDRRSKRRTGRKADRRSTEANAPYLGSVPLDGDSAYLSLSNYHSKRLFDLLGATAATIALAPIAITLAALVRLTTRGPVFESHQRVGKRGNLFAQRAFSIAGNNNRLLTPVGRLLSHTGLVKLPQLLNVLSGDMSIVGPQALSPAEAHFFGSAASVVLSVKPGILSPRAAASDGRQIGGTCPTQAEIDIRYVADRSFVIDLRTCADAISQKTSKPLQVQ